MADVIKSGILLCVLKKKTFSTQFATYNNDQNIFFLYNDLRLFRRQWRISTGDSKGVDKFYFDARMVLLLWKETCDLNNSKILIKHIFSYIFFYICLFIFS